MASRFVSFLWVVGAYVVALAAAVYGAQALFDTGWIPVDPDPLAIAAVADVIGTVVIFGFSMGLRNSSMYDAYWSVAPLPIAAWWATLPEAAEGNPVRQALAVGLLTLWAVRLTWNWASGWPGLHHEDWRYIRLAEQSGPAWPLVSFLGVHMMPTVLVFLGMLPLWPALTSDAPLGVLDAVAAVVMLGAILLEMVADLQLRAFARTRTDPSEVMTTGVWSWSRHPNYLGEIGVWLGLFGFGLAADLGAWWTGIGVVSMVLLFVGISIPLMERRMLRKRPHYAEVQQRISMLVPFL